MITDARLRSLDTQTSELVQKIDQLGAVPANARPDCDKLPELEAAGIELQATIRARHSYVLQRLDQVLAETGQKEAQKAASARAATPAAPAPAAPITPATPSPAPKTTMAMPAKPPANTPPAGPRSTNTAPEPPPRRQSRRYRKRKSDHAAACEHPLA